MKTEHALARALKEMMSNQPLDSISVMEISSKCGVSRKTFYYHYHDIYDLLTQVFLDEKIPGVNSCDNFVSLIEIVYKYYVANEKFIDATLSSAGKDLFSEFIYNIFYITTTCIKHPAQAKNCTHHSNAQSCYTFQTALWLLLLMAQTGELRNEEAK